MTEANPESRRGVQLPQDTALSDLLDHGRERFLDVVTAHPSSSLVWALLAEGALSQGTPDGFVSAYAFASTGYHHGIAALRQAGWRGFEPIPWEHEPNQGFLRSTWLLALAARRLGDDSEATRCADLVRGSSPTAHEVLAAAYPIEGVPAGVPADPTDVADDSEGQPDPSVPSEDVTDATESESAAGQPQPGAGPTAPDEGPTEPDVGSPEGAEADRPLE